MKVRIVKLAAGPAGMFEEGSIHIGPPEMFRGLEYVIIESDAKSVETVEDEPADAPAPAQKRGRRP